VKRGYIFFSLVLFTRCAQSWGTFWDITAQIDVSAASARIGSLLTLSGGGYDFSSLTSVTLAGTEALVISKTASSAVIFIMPNTTSGTINIKGTSRNAISSKAITITTVNPIAAQQGSKIVPIGNTNANVKHGFSTALSADGNTAIVGGYEDNGNLGAAWVYTRSGQSWSQQGSKLVGTGNAGSSPLQGWCVALSADGNTAASGAISDGTNVGAVWIFTRSGTTWSQQGSKLVPNDSSVGTVNFGHGCALSADGNTLVVGGNSDNSNQGAAWIFTRSGTTWSQLGVKLVGTGGTATAKQGSNVAISADATTIAVGADAENTNQGAVWVYVRQGTGYAQQGVKLFGTPTIGTPNQGRSVGLSADGNTLLSTGYNDNANKGSAYIFVRSGTTWSQQTKLIGNDYAVGNVAMGFSASLSADGNTIIAGGYNDNTGVGASWIFRRTGTTWSQPAAKLIGTGATTNANQGVGVAISADATTAFVGGQLDNTNVGASWAFVP